MKEMISTAAKAIESQSGGRFPKTVLVLGSGLGKFGETVENSATISYEDVPGFPVSTVSGHHGQLILGAVRGANIAVMQGRLHLYEGHPIERIVLPIRTFRALGARRIILTNAAGSLKKELTPGALMCLADHINFSDRNPLIGPNDDSIGLRFPDMSVVYDAELRQTLFAAAQAEKIALASGVYLYTSGPSFETPAEVRMFAKMGADAVGMSTVPEAIAAVHCGMRVAGLSIITNHAAGIGDHAITHEETLAAGAQSYETVARLMTRFLAMLHSIEK